MDFEEVCRRYKSMKHLILLCLWSCLGVSAQTLTIQPAVEVQFPTAIGKAYLLRSSTDLTAWNPLKGVQLGDGKALQALIPAAEGRQFFQVEIHDVRDLNALLEPIRTANNVPALACAVIRSNRVVGLGAVGLRKAGVSSAPVTLQDKWHHGSLTKSMTATLAAILVEQGSVRWDTTLEQVFPELASAMKPAWRTVQLDWLCSNRGGAVENLSSNGIWEQLWNFKGTPTEGRRLLLQLLTAREPNSTPGTKYEYSNAGFSIAGHMLETVMKTAWEDLLTDKLFKPLGMTSAGFGVPATPRHINQPWGHQRVSGSNNPMEPGPNSDNPPAIGPSATVHCSLLDLARFAAVHVAGHKSDTILVSKGAMIKLHTAPANNANYAYGWNETTRPWANGLALTHAGSNVQWYSVIWMAPNREFAVVALSNIAAISGTNPGAVATDQAVALAIQQFLN